MSSCRTVLPTSKELYLVAVGLINNHYELPIQRDNSSTIEQPSAIAETITPCLFPVLLSLFNYTFRILLSRMAKAKAVIDINALHFENW